MAPSAATPQGQSSSSPTPNSGHDGARKTLAILGCGAIGNAILLGILSAQASGSKTERAHMLPTRFIACVRRPESADSIRSKLPPQVLDSTVTVHTKNNVAAVEQADVVLLACQANLFAPILEEPGMAAALKGKPIISVLAGRTSEEIESYLQHIAAQENGQAKEWGGHDAFDDAFSVISVMPNVACAVQASSTVLETRAPEHPRPLPKHYLATAQAIFSCLGTVFVTQPNRYAVCTTVNGSTPAFFAMVIDGLVDGAVALGLSRAEATQMVAATMRGTADLVMSGKSTQDLRYEVACPGGATIEGLQVLEEGRTRAVWMDAVRAATSGQKKG